MASLSRSLRPALRRPLVAQLSQRALYSSNGPSSRGPIDPPSTGELGVGELQGAKFKIEPLRRTGESDDTMRARLVYQSRKRGTLESDLLMSTFARTKLPTMTRAQMQQYDLFLDENDWDIYYWATQEESPLPTQPTEKNLHASTVNGSESYKSSPERASKTIDAGRNGSIQFNSGNGKESEKGAQAQQQQKPTEDIPVRERKEGEWAQTVGTFKPAYRPVPARWQGSEILGLLREHVRSRRADGAAGAEEQHANTQGEKGMGFMPPLA